MLSNNTLWNLPWNTTMVVVAIISVVGTIFTFLFIPPTYRWTLPLIVAAVLIVGIVVTALKEIGNRDRKIAELEEEIKRLKIKPYDVALENEALQKLQKFTDDGRKVLRYILMHGPVHAHKINLPDVVGNTRYGAVETGERIGLIRRIEERHGGGIETYWDITEQFKPVLNDLLFSPQSDSHSTATESPASPD